MSPLLWTSKSSRKLAKELQGLGYQISYRTVARMLGAIGFSLQGNSRTREGKQHPDRDAQFKYINKKVLSFQRRKLPVISVDAKKREIIGNFENRGREWQPKKRPEKVRTHNFPDKDLGIAIDEMKTMGLNLPGLSLANKLYEKVSEIGHGTSGTQALILALQQCEGDAGFNIRGA